MAEMSLTLLLLFSTVFLLLASLVLTRNRFDLTPLPARSHLDQPDISILIPVRNEEDNIEKCVHGACRQDYQNFEVLVLDDGSTDGTPAILDKLKVEYRDKLRIRKGRDKPDGWLGKSWACSQLAGAAEGSYYIFIDADVYLKPDVLDRTLAAFKHYSLDMLTVWPRQELKTFWEKTLIPLVYYTLITLLPAVYVYRPPRWMPERYQKRTRKLFAAACGQFLAFSRSAYENSGGHQAVKPEPVEDVSLARNLLRKGYRIRMFEGTDTVHCRMYKSEKEIRSGFRKNFFAGFGYSYTFFIVSAIIHFIVYILPFLLLPIGFMWDSAWFYPALASVTLIFFHWIFLSLWFGWNPLYAFAHPLGVLWFQLLGITSICDRITGKKARWKNRPV